VILRTLGISNPQVKDRGPEDPRDCQSPGEGLTRSTSTQLMMSTKGHGPQSLANEGAKISGTPTQSVDSQGGLGGNATCDHSQRLPPGPLERTVTGDTTVSGPFMAAQPTRGTTLCVGGPPPTVPQGPSAKTLRRREKKGLFSCWDLYPAGTVDQPADSRPTF